MNWIFPAAFSVAALVAWAIERSGAPTTLELQFKGDLKRETRWLAQYGQGACTLIAALLVWRLDAAGERRGLLLLAGVFGTSILATVVKRLLGRARPRRENAGRFLGPTWKHANWRESFPSSHSASAVALSVILAAYYPGGREVFYALAAACALLRYLMDAHWPSDVLAGIALGAAGGLLALQHWPAAWV